MLYFLFFYTTEVKSSRNPPFSYTFISLFLLIIMISSKKIKFFVFIIFFLSTLLLFFFAGAVHYNSESITGFLKAYGSFAVIIYMLLIALASATTLPITLVLIPGVIIFSFINSLIYAMFGIILGAIFTYFFSRYTGKDFLNEYAEKRKKLKNLIEKNSLPIVMILNFVYFFPSNLAHITAGITGLKFSKILIATIAGNFFNIFAILLIILGFYSSNNPYIFAGITILAASSLVPFIVYRKKVLSLIELVYE